MAIIKIENGVITEKAASRINKIEIAGAQIKYTNFSGKGSRYNAEGKRNFELILPEEVALDLYDYGWRIRKNGYDERLGKKRTGGVDENLDEPEYRLKVNVNLESPNPPKIFKKTTKHLVPCNKLYEIASLDNSDISDAFIEINGYDSKHEGKYSGYLKTIVATVGSGMFEELFGDMPIAGQDEEELPFD